MRRRATRTRATHSTRRRVARGRQSRHLTPGDSVQPTAVAAEALRTGVVPLEAPRQRHRETIPGREGETVRAGDPDVAILDNEYSGEEVPGASAPAPDQNDVDDIGRAYGLEEADTGELRTSAELLERRDRRRR